jgi:hypothetical protein
LHLRKKESDQQLAKIRGVGHSFSRSFGKKGEKNEARERPEGLEKTDGRQGNNSQKYEDLIFFFPGRSGKRVEE